MHSFVVGGAGFIGSHLVDRLVDEGSVTVFDDLSSGRREFLARHLERERVTLWEGDARSLDELVEALNRAKAQRGPIDAVFHLSDNPDSRRGLSDTQLDFERGTKTTYHVLEAMRRCEVKRLVFTSTVAVYGETTSMCREEDLGALPISLYGASKLAGEAMISAFVECFGLRGYIFRFGNVVGPRCTHGVMLDFLHKLKETRTELEVLGDGRQAQPYLHVTDCVDGMLFALEHARRRLEVFNLTPPDQTTARRVAELCVAASPYPDAAIRTKGGDRGWPGDIPRSRLAPGRLAELGWTVRPTSDEAVALAVRALADEVFALKSPAE